MNKIEKSVPAPTTSAQSGALADALAATDRLRGPLYARADAMVEALAAQGWRLIHD